MCEIKKVTSEGSKSLFYGGRCEKYEKKNTKKADLEDLFLQRDEILLNSYARSKKNPLTSHIEDGEIIKGKTLQTVPIEKGQSPDEGDLEKKSVSSDDIITAKDEPGNKEMQKTSAWSQRWHIRVGLPFTMLTYEFYPFWDAYFSEMGIELVLSDKTNRKIINDGLGYVVAETCFPIKVMLGHIQNLLDKGG